jgi:Fungal chitosanase of glycosyl hydrolase group 75
MKLLTTIYSKGENYAANIILDEDRPLNGKPCIFFFGDCDEDKDGSPDWHNDPTGDSNTSLHYNGTPLNGNVIPFIVIPPEIANLSAEKFLGCVGMIEWHGKAQAVVVGDAGPHNKVGEASSAALAFIGAPTTHNGNGGIDAQEVLFRIWPGVPARLEIGGVVYQFDLKSWGGLA